MKPPVKCCICCVMICFVTRAVLLSLQKPLQESSALSGLRRYDSCGSLDSRTVNQTAKVDNKSNSSGYNSQEAGTDDSGKLITYFMNQITELTAQSEELGDPRIHLHTPRYTSNETQV